MVTKRKTRKKKKDREEDKLEQLERENRELKAINRSLMKRLKKLDRDFRKVEDLEHELMDMALAEEAKSSKNRCPECQKGAIKETSLGPRIMRKCSNTSCSWCEFKKV